MRIVRPEYSEKEDGRTCVWIFAALGGEKVQVIMSDVEPLDGEFSPEQESLLTPKAARRLADELVDAADDTSELPILQDTFWRKPGTYKVKVHLRKGGEFRMVTPATCRLLAYILHQAVDMCEGRFVAFTEDGYDRVDEQHSVAA